MNQLIDCITSLKDIATLALMWGGASGLIWLHDIVKAKKKANVEVARESGEKTL